MLKLKKINIILLPILILNLTLGSSFLLPYQAEACLDSNGNPTTNCYSCNSDGECVSDPDGFTWCPQCNGKCSSPSSFESSSGPVEVTIVGPSPSLTPVDPSDFFGTISSIYAGTEMAGNAVNTIITLIQNDEKIPDSLKSYVINTIRNADIPENNKNLLIDVIENDEKIPDSLKPLLIDIISNSKDLSGLIRSWVLDLLLKNISVEHICKSLSDTAASMVVFGTSVGTPISIFITQMCPIILNELLATFLEAIPETPAPEHIQTIRYPIFESYQWEFGIPGIVQPGEITPF